MKTQLLIIILVFVTSLSAQISTTADWSVNEEQQYSSFGERSVTAGDVNGDGYSDVLVSAPGYDADANEEYEGKVYLYYGSPTGPATTPSWTFTGPVAEDELIAISTAGDVNGDGYSDVIIGAGYYNKTVYLFLGSASGLPASPDHTIDGTGISNTTENFGAALSTAGDINGDGFSDILIGDSQYENGQVREGAVFVYYGNNTNGGGVSTSPDWYVESNIDYTHLGQAVAYAGDVNGDGYADVIFGSLYDLPQDNSGAVFAFYGSSSGLKTINNPTTDLITAVADFQESGNAGATGELFGSAVSTAGDVNGDGYADVIVGVPSYTDNFITYGKAAVLYGSSSGLTTSSAPYLYNGGVDGEFFGSSVGTAGDVNGDGYSDVIIGARNYSNGNTDEGAAFIYFGSSSGLTNSPNWTVEGNADSKRFGTSVFSAGDVNGDGYSDIITSHSDYSNGAVGEEDPGVYYPGSANVYFGAANNLSTTSSYSDASATAAEQFGYAVSGAGDLNGDGYSDLIVGSNGGRVKVYLGSESGFNITWEATGSAGESFGSAVSTAGDINGDGYSDLIYGTPWVTIDGPNDIYGKIDVLYGGPESGGSWAPSSTLTIEGNVTEGSLGGRVASAGDVNGDGFSDILVGNDAYGGFFRIYYGSASGLNTTHTTYLSSSITGASNSFGSSLSSAGDVNGDGFSDVLVGDYFYNNGTSLQGAAFLFLGSSAGLSSSPAWTIEGGAANENLGKLVANGGDVNGDGYSDILIGNVLTGAHKLYLFEGASGVPSSTASWSFDYSGSWWSNSATAGDVNGDGYGDIIVGDPNNDAGKGRAFLYLGRSTGLGSTPVWTVTETESNASYGYSVASIGDANGDGFSDIVIGARGYDNDANNSESKGGIFVYYGAAVTGKRSSVQQYQNGTSTIIGPNGKVTTDGQIRLAQQAKSPFGRADGKLVYEYATTGSAFSGSTITHSVSSTGKQSSFTDLGLTGTELTEDITGIPMNDAYRWRSRVEYDKITNPYQVYGPWRYYESYQPLSFGSFKNQTTPLPVELETFTASITEEGIILNWNTAAEINNYGFEIERTLVNDPASNVIPVSPKGEDLNLMNWQKIGFVQGHGNSNSPKSYSFIDETAETGTYSYRLKQIDFDGKFEYSEIITVEALNDLSLPIEFALEQNYPNPFNPVTTIKYSIPAVETGHAPSLQTNVVLKVYDILGNDVATLVNEQKSAGRYEVSFNANNLSSGVYIYRLNAGTFNFVRKMMLIK